METYCSAPSSIASEEEFIVLAKYVHHSFKISERKLKKVLTKINPYKKGNKTPCTFCKFKSVCQFDESLEENQYRT